MTDRRELVAVDVTGLGADEIRVVEAVIARIRLGMERYGPLDIARNPKDWRKEASEEFLDGAIYLAMQAIRERDTR